MVGDFWAEANTLSLSEEWATPMNLFGPLHAEFNFNLDPCAAKWNAKTERFFTKEIDGLSMSWAGCRVFMNPPYGKGLGKWIAKARYESVHFGALVICLLPARTDTSWWHDMIEKKADEVRFIKGRITFVTENGKIGRAPFPSCVVIYKPRG